MSLYYDAASVLSSSDEHGSLKSRIYAKNTTLKSKPAHIYALISETAKYDTFLKEVIDNAGVLSQEPKLTPVLALLLVHDHLFSKGGIAAAASHPLRQSVERHKARLQSELTKARLRRRVPTVEQLKAAILKETGFSGRVHPRWARVNTLKSSLEVVVRRHFAGYEAVDSVEKVTAASKDAKVFHYDLHVPDLLAFPPNMDLTKHQAYLNGEVILQDKASCFPAHLLMGTGAAGGEFGGGMDGCAAPGNKTTHMAALVQSTHAPVYACERDAVRSKTLQMMVDKAGAGEVVTVLARQDFLALDPSSPRFHKVTHLLLDPSCSGSGILGREDIPKLALPADPRNSDTTRQLSTSSKKRKRGGTSDHTVQQRSKTDSTESNFAATATDLEQIPIEVDAVRLEKLSNLQSRIVEHAFTFPSARRVTYSTCSIHPEENEAVVFRVLASTAGKTHGWRVLRRDEQVSGLRVWKHRGVEGVKHGLDDEQREACIRCTPADGEGTMGFFVCGFVRDGGTGHVGDGPRYGNGSGVGDWEGFSDG